MVNTTSSGGGTPFKGASARETQGRQIKQQRQPVVRLALHGCDGQNHR